MRNDVATASGSSHLAKTYENGIFKLMKPPEHLKSPTVSLNLTSLIDVVFLLIIFFIVSSNLIQQDVSMPMELPSAETGRIAEESETKKLTINIPQPGTLLIGTEPMDRNQLRQLLIQHREQWQDKTEIRIRTNKDVPYGEIELILVLAAECNVWNVSFAVSERRE
ncbi:hypothetical protein FACS1894189_0300 [Planctomycetales bacterium]|nr:hypothetical protein FACS1894189_0300 [Planctomycetales bacterium]